MSAVDYDSQLVSHLVSEEAIDYFLSEGLTDDLILAPNAKAIYAFALHYYGETTKAPTMEVLEDQFPKFAFPETVSTPHWLVDKLRTRYKELHLQDALRETAKKVRDKDPEDALIYLRDRVFELDHVVSTRRHIYTPEDFDQKMAEYKQAITEDHFRGATIGFEEIDSFTGGQRPGSINFVLARPGRFKTFMLLQSFIHQVQQGYSPVFYTLELTEDEIWRRMICMISGFPYYRLERGEVTDKELKTLTKVYQDWCKNVGEHFIIQPDVYDRTASMFMHEADRLGANSMIIDQLSFMNATKKHARHDLEVQEIVRDLKNIATRKGRKIPILMAAQLNRTAATQKQMADIAQAALSDAIGQIADTAFCLHRTKNMMDMGQVEYGIIKGRNHGTKSWMIDVELMRNTEFKVSEEVSEEDDTD